MNKRKILNELPAPNKKKLSYTANHLSQCSYLMHASPKFLLTIFISAICHNFFLSKM